MGEGGVKMRGQLKTTIKKTSTSDVSMQNTLCVCFVLFFSAKSNSSSFPLSSNELTSFNSSGKPVRLVFVGSYFKSATCRICLGPWKLIFLCPLSHTSLCKLPAEYHPLPWRCVGNSPFVAWWKWAESLNKSEHS